MSCRIHKTCRDHPTCKGVAAGMFLPKYHKGSTNYNNLILLGKENNGTYKNEYNVSAGKLETIDNGCLIKAIIRELKEEFKIEITSGSIFDALFRCSYGIRCFEMGKTLVFVGILPSGFSRKPIKQKMLIDCANKSLPYSYREMSDIEWFDSNNFTQIEGKSYKIMSDFAKGICRNVISTGMLN